METGMICLWSGSIASIPSGYILCNGAGGSPDLRDRFVTGAGTTYAVDATGGAVNHTHPFTSNPHHHAVQGGTTLDGGATYDSDTSDDVATGNTDNGSSLPPYYALAYIMKT